MTSLIAVVGDTWMPMWRACLISNFSSCQISEPSCNYAKALSATCRGSTVKHCCHGPGFHQQTIWGCIARPLTDGTTPVTKSWTHPRDLAAGVLALAERQRKQVLYVILWRAGGRCKRSQVLADLPASLLCHVDVEEILWSTRNSSSYLLM